VRAGTFRADAGDLRWYMTCGDPVCPPPGDAAAGSDAPDAGTVAPCTEGEVDGLPCDSPGAVCGEPDRNCGAVLICADRDPKASGCAM